MVVYKSTHTMAQAEIRLKMPNWYYDKKALRTTPSFNDGISNVKETRYRREGALLIKKVAEKLGIKCETGASGMVYFHRFYMFHSFNQFPRFITACCCLLLAGKVEETPKKCKQIIAAAQEFLNAKQWQTFGSNPREGVLTLERILLKTIKFDLQIALPYQFLVRYAKAFHGIQDDKDKNDLVQMSWTFVNDSFKSTLCLQWEPEIIGIAAIYLASRFQRIKITDWAGRTPSQRHWWEAFASEVSVKLLEDICHQILDVYNPPKADHLLEDSPAEGEEDDEDEMRRSRSPSPATMDSRKLAAPPLPPLGSVPPPLPKEPPQYFAPPPSEPPPMAANFAPPLPPPIPNIVGSGDPLASQNPGGLSAGAPFSHPPPPLPHVMNAPGNPMHNGYYMSPVPPPQDYAGPPPPHQFYQNNSTRHMTGPNRHVTQPSGNPLRDPYRSSNHSHHPYMRGQGAPPYMMPQQRR